MAGFKETIMVGAKIIDLTKDGFPNKRQLPKELRPLIDDIRKENKDKTLEEQKAAILKAFASEG